MIDIDKNSLPYQSKINYHMIKYLRLCRNMNQEQFGQVCKIDQSVLARLESGVIELSINYESRILNGCRTLNVSELEMASVKRIVELKQQKGIL